MDNIKKQTILCVDDDKRNLELLEALLLPKKYALKFSETGADALAQIEAEIPDLVLLDVMMPGMSGFEVLERLRSEERTRLIPVVLVTALNADMDRIKGFDMGCDDFISKPFDKIELMARVQSLLRISCYRSSLDEKEKLWQAAIREMSQPLIVCGPDWVISNLNQSAQRYLMPGTEFGTVNFLTFIFDHYSVSVPWNELNDCTNAPKKFLIEKKSSDLSVIQRTEVSLEVLENSAHEVVNIVLTLRDTTKEESKKAKGFWSFFSFGG
ncbi:MAG: response regulator [Candidatus Omnitrophica bacterium]|nr:response regulator [Candidatus Omnitrophota bacterium]